MATSILGRWGRIVFQQNRNYSRLLASMKNDYSTALPFEVSGPSYCEHAHVHVKWSNIFSSAIVMRGFKCRRLQHNSCNQDENEKVEILQRPCWRCNRIVNPKEDLFFCPYDDCGVIQPPLEQLTYFQILGIAKSFEIDTIRLSKVYRSLQRLIHPDKFSQKSDQERAISEQQASLINKAYSTLLHPLTRGLYILELKGISIEEDSIDMEPGFLMEIMEINEMILELEDVKDVEQIKKENQKNMDNLFKELSSAFRLHDYALAKVLLSKMKYFASIEDRIKEFEHGKAGASL